MICNFKNTSSGIYFLLMLSLTLPFKVQCETANFFYGINNQSQGVFYFAKVEISTGIVTNLQLTPINAFTNNLHACIDNQNQRYFLCTGRGIITFDIKTENIVSTKALPISAPAVFKHMQYNSCDSNIYGIINNYPTDISFARYNPISGEMKIISTYTEVFNFSYGAQSIIDPDSNIFVIDLGSGIATFNLSTGDLFRTEKGSVQSGQFGHIALKCSTHEIIGTSANINSATKYLAKINPKTGEVTHISQTSWNLGIIKPANGGNCIHQQSGNYYYVAAGGLICINTESGEFVSHQPFSGGNINLIYHFSDCPCKTYSFVRNKKESALIDFNVFPNPFTEQLNIDFTKEGPFEFAVYDLSLKIVSLQEFFSSSKINTEELSEGTYFYVIRDNQHILKKGKIQKK
jgi:hypothetical protein